jgi:hypothetical protein
MRHLFPNAGKNHARWPLEKKLTDSAVRSISITAAP